MLLVPVAGVVYAVLLAAGDLGASVAALRDLDPRVLGAAVAAEVATVLSLAQVYRSSLRAVGGELGYAQALETSMSAFTVTQVLPGGGAFGVVVATRRMIHLGATRGTAAAAAALTGILAMLTLGLMVAVGLAAAVAAASLPAGVLLPALAGTVAMAGLAGVLLRMLQSPASARRVVEGVDRLTPARVDLTRWRESMTEVAGASPGAGRLARVVAWSTVNWGTDALALWLVLAGLGATPTLGVLVAAFAIEHVAVMVPVSPGGIGLAEAGMAGALVALGTPASVAVPGVLGYRVLSYWLPMLAGVPQYLRGPRQARRPTRR